MEHGSDHARLGYTHATQCSHEWRATAIWSTHASVGRTRRLEDLQELGATTTPTCSRSDAQPGPPRSGQPFRWHPSMAASPTARCTAKISPGSAFSNFQLATLGLWDVYFDPYFR